MLVVVVVVGALTFSTSRHGLVLLSWGIVAVNRSARAVLSMYTNRLEGWSIRLNLLLVGMYYVLFECLSAILLWQSSYLAILTLMGDVSLLNPPSLSK